MYKFCFYVPPSHLESVKAAVFAAGGGRIGEYDSCCWQALGEGQFRPGKGSNPFIGEQGRVERVPEFKVEMVCGEEALKAVIEAMLATHPYEEPAWDVTAVLTEIPQ